MVKAKKEGTKVVIETRRARTVPYRVYNDSEIDEFIRQDKLSKRLAKKIKIQAIFFTP